MAKKAAVAGVLHPAVVTAIREELKDYHAGYDAHKDRLSDEWEMRESVNKMLRLLRTVLEGTPK